MSLLGVTFTVAMIINRVWLPVRLAVILFLGVWTFIVIRFTVFWGKIAFSKTSASSADTEEKETKAFNDKDIVKLKHLEDLRRLKRLFEEGLITKTEFERKRLEILRKIIR